MTQTELKNFIRATLVRQRSINQEIIAFDAVIDFITQAITSGIPDWTNALIFNLDGSGAGSFCTEPDTNGAIRFWKTKTDGNVGNQPPTNPLTTENTYWIEVSPSDGSAIKEWAAGVFGTGLIIVYHNHNTAGRGLYILTEPVRPFNSTNIETEITDGKWARFVNKLSTVLGAGNDAGGLQIKNVADPTLPQDVDTKAARDLAIANAITAIGRLVGGWASASLPTTGFAGGSISSGDYWKITATITIAGIGDLKAGDTLVASIDNAVVAADFFALQSNVDQATSSILGLVKLYTNLSASNTDGSPSQAAVKAVTDLLAPIESPTLTGIPAAPTAAPGTNTTQLATTAFVKALGDLKKDIANAAPTTVTTSGSLTINSVSGSLLTLDCANKEESKFKFVGDTTPLSIAVDNFPEGAYCILTIERTSNVNVSIRFKNKTYLLSNTQLINNGKDALILRGRSSGRTVAVFGIYSAGEVGAQDNQSSPATTNLVNQLKFVEDTAL